MSQELKLLTARQLEKELKKLSLFQADKSNKKLTAIFSFDTHIEALVFIARITVHAEVAHHHPDITFSYAKVKVVTTTHELKGISKKDIALVKKIEQLEMR